MSLSWLEYLKLTAALEPDTVTRAHLLKDAEQIAKTKKGSPPHLPEYKKLMTISGIGETKARQLAAAGITFDNVSMHLDKVPRESQLFLKFRPVTEIPGESARELAKKICKKYGAVLAGSVRRHAEFSKDIDIIIVNDQKAKGEHVKIRPQLVISDGPDKCSFLFKSGAHYYKVDLFYCDQKELPFMLLYLTGSKEFNIRMRAHAKSRGLLLNQHGLYRDSKPVLVAQTEAEIFKFIDMKWIPPERR